MKSITAQLPSWLKKPFKRLRNELKYAGTARYCPICKKSAREFRPGTMNQRKNAQCPFCDSLERHRLAWLFFLNKTDLFDGKPKQMLHIAPEPCLEPQFKHLLGKNYLTADLMNPRAMIKMDITDIRYPDESFDVIYCSHVLEHVPDDRGAMREFHRVLKKDGWAVLLVPITAETTYEDPSITTPEGRLAAFGQADHVRRYGPDYVDRLREAGFRVEKHEVSDLVAAADVERMGLASATGEIYYCRK